MWVWWPSVYDVDTYKSNVMSELKIIQTRGKIFSVDSAQGGDKVIWLIIEFAFFRISSDLESLNLRQEMDLPKLQTKKI